MGPKKKGLGSKAKAPKAKPTKEKGKKGQKPSKIPRASKPDIYKVRTRRLIELRRRKHALLKLQAELEEKNSFLRKRTARFINPDQWELQDWKDLEKELIGPLNQWEDLFDLKFSKIKQQLFLDFSSTEVLENWSLSISYKDVEYDLNFKIHRKDELVEALDVTVELPKQTEENLELERLLSLCAEKGKLADIFQLLIAYELLRQKRQICLDNLTNEWQEKEIFYTEYDKESGQLVIFIGPKESFIFKVLWGIKENVSSGKRLRPYSSLVFGTEGEGKCQQIGLTAKLVKEKIVSDLPGLLNDLLRVAYFD